jgi:2-polyprenyl-6-methoxyphenol hydroxylase-like FAD-dependent oxidoreductase
VQQVRRAGEGFEILVTTPEGELQIAASQVIGAHGKTAFPDRTRRPDRRPARARFNGVKFHVPRDRLRALAGNEIQIFASRGIYCGLNAVNDNAVTLCFLERRSAGDRPPRDRLIELISTNPGFAEVVGPGSDNMLDDLPVYGAGNIDFRRRTLVRDGVFMVGDAAQVIAPVAGDGIAVAMQSGQVLSKILSEGRKRGRTPEDVAGRYGSAWRALFQRRMMLAGGVQRLLFSGAGRAISAATLTLFPSLQERAIHYTRG